MNDSQNRNFWRSYKLRELGLEKGKEEETLKITLSC